jgi:hypothetical protein
MLIAYLFSSLFSLFPRLHVCPYMLLINAYCLSIFPSFFCLPAVRSVALHALINAYCPFLFPSLFRLLALFPSTHAPFKPNLPASNKCLLPIFLFVAFLSLPAFSYIYSPAMLLINTYCTSFFPPLFRPSRPFSVNFTPHLDLAGMRLINAY